VRVKEVLAISAAGTRNGNTSTAVHIVVGSDVCGDLDAAESREWLVTNGIGGYASGAVVSLLTRRYHAILMAALNPPANRVLDETAAYDGRGFSPCRCDTIFRGRAGL
jgi:hypothetical protein